MLRRLLTVLCVLVGGASLLQAQAKPTAARTGDLQLGVDYVGGKSDYNGGVKGEGFYTTFDFTRRFGGEFDIHQANTSSGSVYERTYEIGARYYKNYGRVAPYAKVMIGRGVFNFPFGEANLAYNMFALGGGADVRITRYLNARADYEYQFWESFPPNGLNPQLFTIGVAYHFPGGLGRGRHY